MNRTSLLLFLLCTISSCGQAVAQNHIAVNVIPADQFAKSDSFGRLSADLQAASDTGGTFEGVMRKGGSVLRYPDSDTFNKGREILKSLPYVQDAYTPDPDRFETEFVGVTKLVIFIAAGQVPPDATLAPLDPVKRSEEGGYLVVQPPDGINPSVLKLLSELEGVLYVEPAYGFFLDSVTIQRTVPPVYVDPSAPDFSWAVRHSRATLAWQRVVSTPAIVAILDTGIDYNHHDLAPNIWRNLHEIPGNGLDDDGNGYVDDVHGYSFWESADEGPHGDPMDQHGHGTFIAGMVGARADINGPPPGGQVFAGVVWDIRIMALRVVGTDGTAPIDNFLIDEAVRYAVRNGAKIINASWGSYADSVTIRNAMSYAQREGVLVVAAAGNKDDGNNNDTHPYYPASYEYDNIISVLSVEDDDALSGFSHLGAVSVDIAAPGGDQGSTHLSNNYTVALSGTSFAAAHVAGAVALIWGHPGYRCASWRDIKTVLMNNVRSLASLQAPKKCVSGGTLDVSFLQLAAACECSCLSTPQTIRKPKWPNISIIDLFAKPH